MTNFLELSVAAYTNQNKTSDEIFPFPIFCPYYIIYFKKDIWKLQEILELCEFIYLNSCEDEDQRSIMLFGDLFKLYTRISDKVVGKLNKYAKKF